MNFFVCPVCGGELLRVGSSFKCSLNHNFDISKFGYVNLLMSSKSSAKRHGDDRLMVKARRDFLDKGYYGFLCEKLCDICNEYLPDGSAVLDAGCGECYYSSAILRYYNENGKTVIMNGVDISKDALEFAFKRKSGVTTAVASVFNLPVAENSADAVLNVFSPEAFEEYRRVLKSGGILLRVVPLKDHLFELKKAVYDTPYYNDPVELEIDGFTLINETVLEKEIVLDTTGDILNLFRMTPYYYKTSADDQHKLELLETLSTKAQFSVRVYRKD